MMKFRRDTQLPLDSLSFLNRLKWQYQCGPLAALGGEQRAMLQALDGLRPREQYLAVRAAIEAGRDYLLGSDLLGALAPEVQPRPIEDNGNVGNCCTD